MTLNFFQKLIPEDIEIYLNYLKNNDYHQESIEVLVTILNNPKFRSKYGRSEYDLWRDLLTIIAENPKQIPQNLDVDAIFYQGIRKFVDQVGTLWTLFAEFYIAKGMFEKAKLIYEESIGSLVTVADFSKIYDTYMQFLETVLIENIEKKSNSLVITFLISFLSYL